MDAFAPVKDEASRRHPEDLVDSDIESEIDSNASIDFENDAHDNEDFVIPGTGPKDMPLFKPSSKLSGSHQTGVKGVIADATSFETARRQTRRQQKQKSADYTFAGYISPSEMDARTPLNQASDPESGDDEGFIRSWRKHRMAELRTGIATQRKQSPSKRKYGRVVTVDAVGYLDAIEKVSPETVVVVTIFNDESDESRFVEDCLNTLCRRYPTTRFVKLHHVEAEMEASVVPAVLAYKAGELFANIIRIVDEIPPGRNLSTDSLELVLRSIVSKDRQQI
ncbi:thioredoxin-like protein [Tricharina praecox]|uniref:thioredoxin-like protein n=1 Tax=Tricharina praecox TaxID=43433 RepID=UPI00221ECFC7|nr:thioredoxin-like protein [Tricharina praecox]KAI5845505.1 thioredoxin-like protein [Tricharina praecox]